MKDPDLVGSIDGLMNNKDNKAISNMIAAKKSRLRFMSFSEGFQ